MKIQFEHISNTEKKNPLSIKRNERGIGGELLTGDFSLFRKPNLKLSS